MITNPADTRHVGLDMLRGAAVAAVFFFHATLELNRSLPGAEPGEVGWLGQITSHPLAFFVPGHLGQLGVQLFFVISGFCIHQATLRWDRRHLGATGRQRWSAYFRRRFWRIYPLYTGVLLALLLVEAAAGADAPGDRPSALSTAAVHGSFLQTLIPGHINRVNPSFWSLAVEVQWYTLYPLIYLAIRRFGAVATLVPALGLCLFWRLVLPELTAQTAVLQLPFRWGFEWLLGVAAAVAVTDHDSWFSRVWAQHLARYGGPGLIVLGLAAVALLLPTRLTALYIIVPPLVFTALILWVTRTGGAKAYTERVRSRSRPSRLAALGRMSYAFYLVHQPMLAASASALIAWGIGPDEALPFVLTTITVGGATVLLAAVLERAARRLEIMGQGGSA